MVEHKEATIGHLRRRRTNVARKGLRGVMARRCRRCLGTVGPATHHHRGRESGGGYLQQDMYCIVMTTSATIEEIRQTIV